MDWDRLRIFHSVANAGSFTKASQTLNVSQSAISRQVNLLEEELGIPLFHRIARGLSLTHAGQDLYETAQNVFAKLETAKAEIGDLKRYPRGYLRVATPLTFGSLWLSPYLQEFLDKYPHVRMTLLLKDEEVSLHMREADISISTFPVQSPDLITCEPVLFRVRAYASRSYLKTYGTPETAQDLDHHHLIVFGKEIPFVYTELDFLLTAGTPKPRIPYSVMNSGQAIFETVRSGLGIAALYEYIVKDDPEIVEVLPYLPPVYVPHYISYPVHLAGLKRIHVFVNHFLQKMRDSQNETKNNLDVRFQHG